jgi:hypothetical protein
MKRESFVTKERIFSDAYLLALPPAACLACQWESFDSHKKSAPEKAP